MENIEYNEMVIERLKFEIISSNMSNKKIAEKLGVNPSMISDYKNGKKFPSLLTFGLLCKIIGADANYILGITNN